MVKFNKSKILVIGDLMLDEYIFTEVNRISPEAPVPVAWVDNEKSTLGGAGNVVNNLVALGASVAVVGAVGNDYRGRHLLNKLNDLGVFCGGVVVDPERPTTSKTRIMSSNQQILRIDREETSELQRDQFDKGFSRVQFKEFDAVILSDYGKGVVTKYLMSKVIPKMAAKFMAVDPTGHDYSKYKGATIITPNLQEAEYAANMFLKDDASFEEAAKRLIKYTNNVLITRGKNGMVLFEEDVSPLYIPTKAKEVYDVSGAGDTVIAVLTLAVTSRYKLAEAAEIANKAAGIVVGKMGTATVSIEEINKSVERNI